MLDALALARASPGETLLGPSGPRTRRGDINHAPGLGSPTRRKNVRRCVVAIATACQGAPLSVRRTGVPMSAFPALIGLDGVINIAGVACLLFY